MRLFCDRLGGCLLLKAAVRGGRGAEEGRNDGGCEDSGGGEVVVRKLEGLEFANSIFGKSRQTGRDFGLTANGPDGSR